jgi:hypothetical protein
MASGERLFVLNQKVTELAPWSHRSNAGDELLRWRTEVTVCRSTENEIDGNKGSRRCARLPGTCWCGQPGRRRRVAAEIDDELAGVGEGNDDFAVD